MDWFLVFIRLLLFGSCTGQGVLATLQWANRTLPELASFAVASFIMAVAQALALVWYLFGHAWWLGVYLVLGSYLLAASVYLIVGSFHSHRDQSLENTRESAAMAALALISVFLMGLSNGGLYHLNSGKQSLFKKEHDVENQTVSGLFDKDTKSEEWTSLEGHSEELSLNKSHKFNSPEIPQCLNNKDSDGTLVGRNLDQFVISEDPEDACVSWLVQASTYHSALDERPEENWMASKLHYSVGGEFYRPPSSTDHHSSNSGLTRSNTTGQLRVNKSRKIKTRSSSATFFPRYMTLSETHHGQVLVLKHERALSTDPNTHTRGYQRPAPASLSTWSHNASESQSTNHSTAVNTLSAHQKLSLSGSLAQTKLINTLESSSAQEPLPNTPENDMFLSAPYVPEHSSGYSMGDIMEGLDEMPCGLPQWSVHNKSSMRNISLQEWERNKHSWLACEHEVKPIVYYLNPGDEAPGPGGLGVSQSNYNIHRASDEKLVRSFSAPSLHTYRPVADPSIPPNDYVSEESSLHHQELALSRVNTPPALIIKPDIPTASSSPIKKIMKFIKRDLILEANVPHRGNGEFEHGNASGHRPNDSIADSMISSTSTTRSSRPGLPRKAIKNLFSRSLADIQHRPPFSFAMTPKMSPQKNPQPLVYSKSKKALNFRFRDWEADLVDVLDQSRVSSVPSAVIGEYDREKWRTLKELQQQTEPEKHSNTSG